MNNIKIIFTDIDDTLFSHKTLKFDKQSIDALNKLQKQGVIIFLATARPHHSLKHLGILKYMKPDGIISGNGNNVFYNGKNIYSYHIKPSYVKQSVKSFLKYNLNCEVVGKKYRFLINDNLTLVKPHFEEFIDVVPPIKTFKNQEACSLMLFAEEKWDAILAKEIPSNIRYYRYSKYGIDITGKETKKGEMVDFVLNYLHLSKDNAMAFGDDYGDISLLEAVKYGIAMGNGVDELKKSSYFVSKDIENHGVSFAVQHFDLLKD